MVGMGDQTLYRMNPFPYWHCEVRLIPLELHKISSGRNTWKVEIHFSLSFVH